MSSSRVDRFTEKFVIKEVHGQLVRVRILKPFKADDETPIKTKHMKKQYCTYCEMEIFDAGKVCDLCGREF